MDDFGIWNSAIFSHRLRRMSYKLIIFIIMRNSFSPRMKKRKERSKFADKTRQFHSIFFSSSISRTEWFNKILRLRKIGASDVAFLTMKQRSNVPMVLAISYLFYIFFLAEITCTFSFPSLSVPFTFWWLIEFCWKHL